MIDGYDRMEVLKRYARRRWRRRGEEPKEKPAATAAMGLPDPSRVCAYCRTSQTPLWRSGPNGPKSLCNACGIRYHRKRTMKAEMNGFKGVVDKQQKTTTTTFRATSTIKKNNGSKMASMEAVEIRRRQKEDKMLLLLLDRQKQKGGELMKAAAMADARRGGGAGKEEAEAAMLLLSLSSSGFLVHY